jgi:hypothetical protein
MDAFDRFWQWADKPLDSPLTIFRRASQGGHGPRSPGPVGPRESERGRSASERSAVSRTDMGRCGRELEPSGCIDV